MIKNTQNVTKTLSTKLIILNFAITKILTKFQILNNFKKVKDMFDKKVHN